MDWRNKFDMIRNKVKTQLHAKGVDTLISLATWFQQFDLDGSGTLNKVEFEKFAAKIGTFLTTQELTTVYNAFDLDKDGQIHFKEFVQALRTDFAEKRLAAVKHAWDFLDQNRQGYIAVSDLLQQYNAAVSNVNFKLLGGWLWPLALFQQAHPRVRTRDKKAETVAREFEEAITSRSSQGTIDENSFIEMYADLNACLPAEKDEYFKDVVLSTWGLGGESAFVSTQRLQEIETMIFEKVRQRTHGADDEGKTIKKTFRHFDLNDSGTICFPEFKKALESYGIIYKDQELQSIFQKYDTDRSGNLDYEEFAAVFAKLGSGNNPNVNPVFGIGKEPPNTILDKIRKTLKERGANGIRGIGIVFRRMDDNGDKSLDRYEFQWGLRENGHKLNPAEFEKVFKYFDKSNNGKIDYNEFIRAIRGELNASRRALVDQVFKKLDKTGDGFVTTDDLVGSYNVEHHPKFKTGEMSKKEILEEFMSQWDTKKKDNKVTPDEFADYYTDVSASIDRDDYFELMIRNAWHLEGGEGWSANTSIPRELEVGPDGQQRVVLAKGHENFSYDDNTKRFWGGEN